MLTNVSSTAFASDAAVVAFITTVSGTLSTTPDLVVTLTGAARRRRMLLQGTPTTTVNYVVQYGYFGNGASAAYNAVITQLSGAVLTNAFTASLRANAAVYNAPPLLYATSSVLPTFSGYSVNSPTNTQTSNSSSSSGSATTGIIVGVVIGVIVLLVLILFLCRRRDKRAAEKEDNKFASVNPLPPSRAPTTAGGEPAAGAEAEKDEEKGMRGDGDDEDSVTRSEGGTPAHALAKPGDRVIAVRSMTSVGGKDAPPKPPRGGNTSPGANRTAPALSTGARPSDDPSSRVPQMPGRKPRRSIKYSWFGRNDLGLDSPGSRKLSMQSMTSFFNPFEEVEVVHMVDGRKVSQSSRDSDDPGPYINGVHDDSRSEISDSVAPWDGASVFSGNTEVVIEFPVPFRGDPLTQVNVQIGWNCLYADGRYLVEMSDSPSNLTSFVLESGRKLKSMAVQCESVDSNFMRHLPFDDLKAIVWGELPFDATSCLGRYEDQMLLMVTDARHNLQKDASKKPLWRWVAKELAPDALIPSGASMLVIMCNKTTKVASSNEKVSLIPSHLRGYLGFRS